MKTALFLPLLFILVTVALAFVLLAVLLVMGWSVTSLPIVASPVLLVSAIGATVLVLLRTMRRVISPVITYLSTLFVVAVSVTGVLLLLSDDPSVGGESVTGAGRLIAVRQIEPNTLYQGRQFTVATERIVGSDLGAFLVVDHRVDQGSPRIQRDDEAYLDRRDGSIVRPGRDDISIGDLEGFGGPAFPAMVTRSTSDVIGTLEEMMRSSRRPVPLPFALPARVAAGFPAFLTVLILALAIVGIWTPMRLTRWPLFNLVVSAAYARFLVAVPRLVGWLMEWSPAATWTPAAVRDEAAILLWLLMAIVAIAVAVLLPSLAEWRHNMHYGETKR